MSTLKVGAIQSTTGNAAITVPNAGGLGVASIKSTTGNAALTVAASGLVTTSVKHAFYMYRSTAQSITSGGYQKIQYDASRINLGGGVTTGSSAKYTVPTGGDGLYFLNAHNRYESGSTFNAFVGIKLNDTGIVGSYYKNEYYDGFDVFTIRELSAGDIIEVQVSHSHSSALNVGASDQGDTAFMCGYRLG